MVWTGAAADPHDFADLRRSPVRLIRHLRDLAVAAQLGSAAMELEDELFARAVDDWVNALSRQLGLEPDE
jgi:hypothetical protein